MLVTELIADIKRKAQMQQAQTVITDADLVAWANRQLQNVICPKLLSLRQSYFQGQKDYALSYKRRYRLPPRILGDRISLIKIIDTNGGQYNLIQTSINERSTNRQGFYVTQGDIILTGDLPTGTMRVFYPIRPPLMTASGGLGYPINSVGTSNFTSTTAPNGNKQVIRSGSPYRTVSPSVTIASSTGIDNDSTDYERYQVGDLVINYNETGYVPLQDQLCDWLAQRVYMRYLQALGHNEQLGAAGSKLADIEKDMMALLSPRVENQPKVILGMQSLGWRQ